MNMFYLLPSTSDIREISKLYLGVRTRLSPQGDPSLTRPMSGISFEFIEPDVTLHSNSWPSADTIVR